MLLKHTADLLLSFTTITQPLVFVRMACSCDQHMPFFVKTTQQLQMPLHVHDPLLFNFRFCYHCQIQTCSTPLKLNNFQIISYRHIIPAPPIEKLSLLGYVRCRFFNQIQHHISNITSLCSVLSN